MYGFGSLSKDLGIFNLKRSVPIAPHDDDDTVRFSLSVDNEFCEMYRATASLPRANDRRILLRLGFFGDDLGLKRRPGSPNEAPAIQNHIALGSNAGAVITCNAQNDIFTQVLPVPKTSLLFALTRLIVYFPPHSLSICRRNSRLCLWTMFPRYSVSSTSCRPTLTYQCVSAQQGWRPGKWTCPRCTSQMRN